MVDDLLLLDDYVFGQNAFSNKSNYFRRKTRLFLVPKSASNLEPKSAPKIVPLFVSKHTLVFSTGASQVTSNSLSFVVLEPVYIYTSYRAPVCGIARLPALSLIVSQCLPVPPSILSCLQIIGRISRCLPEHKKPNRKRKRKTTTEI